MALSELAAAVGDWLTSVGVAGASIVFGAAGAALGMLYTPNLSRKQAFAAFLAGIACASIGPQALLHLLSMPQLAFDMPKWANNAASFVVGVGGMYIVPLILKCWQLAAEDPIGFLPNLFDKLRGIPPRNKGGDQ